MADAVVSQATDWARPSRRGQSLAKLLIRRRLRRVRIICPASLRTRDLAGTERLSLGSVSETLLKYAPCSVLIVRRSRA